MAIIAATIRRLTRTSLAMSIIAGAALSIAAQERPLSPPEKTPVPMTDGDQERGRMLELAKPGDKKPVSNPTLIPKLPGRHISSGNAAIDALVYDAATRYGLDPCLILSVMGAESAFNRNAVSPKGASGLMQLMPATASRFGVRNIFDARENVLGGASYLRWLLERFGGDVRLALAGYNAGEGAVEFYGYRIPPFLETQSYVRTIYARYSRIHASPISDAIVAADQISSARQRDQPSQPIPTYNQIIRFTSSNGDEEPSPPARRDN
ncbi:MAG TPA: lytic transglycosylase domain-containing protein [Blastocatellia bacterium]|nr:lytic transglycosylase domain-containing protein [Blastocatellia bacterium]